MKRFLLVFLPYVWSLGALRAAGNCDYAALVSPLVGTLSSFEVSTGNLYPAITRPWAMNSWTPQTGRNGDGWTYKYTDLRLRGFKQTHQPSPWINDYGVFSLMPTTERPLVNQDERASWFSHMAEEAHPYYYKVYLADHNVTVELAPTERAAVFRLTYPKGKEAFLTLDAQEQGSHVEIQPERRRIVGYSSRHSSRVTPEFKNYFVIEFDAPFTYRAVADDDRLVSNQDTITCAHASAVVGLGKVGGAHTVRVASSFISLEQAERNLQQEVGTRSIEEVAREGHDAWNRALGRIEVSTEDADKARTFYSCLYRTLIFPHGLHEMDATGQAWHRSPLTGMVEKGYYYTDFGVWDVFRALFPLLHLVYPEVGERVQAGFVNMYREGGFLPEWTSPGYTDCMVGNNSASVVADAYLAGLRNYDAEALWQAVVHGAHAVHPRVRSTGRLGWAYYDSLGYIPYDAGINESAARTLEYAYDDWCIYRFGQALGKAEQELAPYKQAALNYRNLYDRETRLMRGRKQDGTFVTPFEPLKWGDAFTEGNAWHYTWSVFHDPEGLIRLMGGASSFCQMLDSVFVQAPNYDDSYYGGTIHEIREMQIMNFGQYAHGNQPIQHMIYLYDWAAQPWKTQYWVREVMNRLYRATPDGYCGDEDNGQTSAWYVFSALGFYPVCPASGQYALGAPYFNEIRLHMPQGKTVHITAKGQSDQKRYVDELRMNGKAYKRNYITLEQLRNGSKLHFHMSEEPNRQRGVNEEASPYSFSKP